MLLGVPHNRQKRDNIVTNQTLGVNFGDIESDTLKQKT